MPRIIVPAPDAPAAIGTCAQTFHCGDTERQSGQISLDRGSRTLVEADGILVPG